jgi:hypothetical protein
MVYGALPRIYLHSVIADADGNGHLVPLLVRYNEGLLYIDFVEKDFTGWTDLTVVWH